MQRSNPCQVPSQIHHCKQTPKCWFGRPHGERYGIAVAGSGVMDPIQTVQVEAMKLNITKLQNLGSQLNPFETLCERHRHVAPAFQVELALFLSRPAAETQLSGLIGSWDTYRIRVMGHGALWHLVSLSAGIARRSSEAATPTSSAKFLMPTLRTSCAEHEVPRLWHGRWIPDRGQCLALIETSPGVLACLTRNVRNLPQLNQNHSNFTFKKTCQKSSNKMAISLRQAALRKKIRHKIPLVLLHWLPEPLWAKLLGEGHRRPRWPKRNRMKLGAFCNDLPAVKHIIPSRPPVLQVALGERDRASPESSPTMDDRKVKACRLNKFLNKLK